MATIPLHPADVIAETGSTAAAVPITGAWYLAVLFGLANCVSFMDRSFIGLVIDPVKKTLHLTDTQIGLLIGPAFILFYSAVALPLGVYADRRDRRTLIAAGMVAWSLCTAACGIVAGFGGLMLARMGVGLGEATLSPAAVSVLSDVHPPRRLSRAIGLFTGIGALGASLSLILGGLFLGALAKHPVIAVPLVGDRAPWQVAFLLLGLPGIVLSLVVLATVREPRRRGRGIEEKASLGLTLRYLVAHPRATIMVIVGLSAISASAGGGWMVSLFIRHYGWSAARVGPLMGIVALVCGFPGIMLGSAIADRLRRRGHVDANLRVILGALCVSLPATLLAPNAGDPYLTLGCSAVATLATMICFGCTTPMMPMIAPPQMRSQITAIYILGGNVMGLGVGPVAIPLLNDYVFHSPDALRWSLTIVPGAMIALALVLLVAARRAFATRVAAVAAAAGPAPLQREPS